MKTCKNCGADVSDRYALVFTPNGATNPAVCPSCPDKVRDDGKPRLKHNREKVS